MPRKLRVLIVDDSASVRQTLSAILNEAPDIEAVGTAADPYAAARRIQEDLPDVIILDLELPRMDGLTFLRKIMAQKPIPVIICSTLAEQGSRTLVEVMDAGAVDVLPKSRSETRQFLLESAAQVCEAVRAAAGTKLRARLPRRALVEAKLSADVIMPAPVSGRHVAETDRVICIGASTGGTEAVRNVLEHLPSDCPGIVVVQHMPEHFTAAFARRLNNHCDIEVREAVDGDIVQPGLALIAPGSHHVLLQRRAGRYHVVVQGGPLVSRHRPSVDVLFRSAALAAGANAMGIILTGMGDDGATGLLEMRNAGALTLAQDEDSCVVFGMPKEAIGRGGAARVVPLAQIPAEIMRAASMPYLQQPA